MNTVFHSLLSASLRRPRIAQCAVLISAASLFSVGAAKGDVDEAKDSSVESSSRLYRLLVAKKITPALEAFSYESEPTRIQKIDGKYESAGELLTRLRRHLRSDFESKVAADIFDFSKIEGQVIERSHKSVCLEMKKKILDRSRVRMEGSEIATDGSSQTHFTRDTQDEFYIPYCAFLAPVRSVSLKGPFVLHPLDRSALEKAYVVSYIRSISSPVVEAAGKLIVATQAHPSEQNLPGVLLEREMSKLLESYLVFVEVVRSYIVEAQAKEALRSFESTQNEIRVELVKLAQTVLDAARRGKGLPFSPRSGHEFFTRILPTASNEGADVITSAIYQLRALQPDLDKKDVPPAASTAKPSGDSSKNLPKQNNCERSGDRRREDRLAPERRVVDLLEDVGIVKEVFDNGKARVYFARGDNEGGYYGYGIRDIKYLGKSVECYKHIRVSDRAVDLSGNVGTVKEVFDNGKARVYFARGDNGGGYYGFGIRDVEDLGRGYQ